MNRWERYTLSLSGAHGLYASVPTSSNKPAAGLIVDSYYLLDGEKPCQNVWMRLH